MKNILKSLRLPLTAGLCSLLLNCSSNTKIEDQNLQEKTAISITTLIDNASNKYLKINIHEYDLGKDSAFTIDEIQVTDAPDAKIARQYTSSSAGYILTTLDDNRKILGQYSFFSPLFLIAEDFSGNSARGHIFKMKDDTTSIIIPYNLKLRSIEIDDRVSKTNIPLNIK